jgi:hypothetical protein
MMAGLSFEAFASNLGVLDMGPPEAVQPVAIWGPAILAQVQGELNTGICTFNGQLRIASTTAISMSATHFPYRVAWHRILLRPYVSPLVRASSA